jgi:hypothetical protein
MASPILVIGTHEEQVRPWPARSWDAPGAAVAQHFMDCSSGALETKNRCVQKLSYGQRCGIEQRYQGFNGAVNNNAENRRRS